MNKQEIKKKALSRLGKACPNCKSMDIMKFEENNKFGCHRCFVVFKTPVTSIELAEEGLDYGINLIIKEMIKDVKKEFALNGYSDWEIGDIILTRLEKRWYK